MNSSFLGLSVLSELESLGGKTARCGTRTRQLWAGCHPQSTPFLSSPRFCVRESPPPAPLGLPQDPRAPETRSRGGERAQPGSGGPAAGCGPRGRFPGAVGTPPRSPAGPRRRGGSSLQQVPRGHARPGGCKPQAKVERGWRFPSNPFYTVKTAELSPRRPLLIGKQTDEKPKQTCGLTFFPDVFPSQKSPLCSGKPIRPHACSLRAWAGALATGHPASLSPGTSPGIGVHPRVPPSTGRAEATRTMHASSVLPFLGTGLSLKGQSWALGHWRLRAHCTGRSRFL